MGYNCLSVTKVTTPSTYNRSRARRHSKPHCPTASDHDIKSAYFNDSLIQKPNVRPIRALTG
ncbi:hypothetical protein KC19_VG160700 [Ceratodon purpureus]|uniref:Uncharacterized protein n=1 Tax=Ceratodon purpureus TaxID=3225 RepID=A0A8T0HQW1_CERPU|nr:hypothetical protein KC19_VG160700 [Ceratodon purpureus]